MALGSCRLIRRCPFFGYCTKRNCMSNMGNVICLGVPKGLQGVLVLAGVLQGRRSCLGPIVIIFSAWTD